MRKFTKDNQGVALITVVIGVMFCLLLTSTMLRVSLLGLQSRSINNQVSDTFYDAENVVDTIRLNLQNTAARAWATTNNDATSSYNFVAETYRLITGKAYSASGSLSLTSTTDKATAISNLTANAIAGGTVTDIGDIVRFNGDTGKLEGITIKDVEVKFENPKTKMVSYVKTDITIRAPLYASKKKFPLASYSMFAGTGANIWNAQGGSSNGKYGNPNQFGFLEQEGNVYFGYTTWRDTKNADALLINGRETLILSGDNVVINGNVYLKDYSNLQLTGADVEIRGKIYLGPNCHLIVGTKTNLKCQDIRICSSDADVKYNSTNYQSVAGSYTKALGDAYTYNGSPYKCYQSFKDLDNAGFQNSNPQYINYPASIVYIDPDHVDTAPAYDAVVSNHKAYKRDGAALTISIDSHVDTDQSDSELHPKPRRNTENEDGTGAVFSKSYDPFFIEMVDVTYYEKFMYDSTIKNVTQNAKADHKIKDSVFNPNNAKNEPSGVDAYESSGLSEYKLAYDGVTLNGTNNPTFRLYFTSSTNTGNGNLVNVSERPFVLSSVNVELNQDSTTANYCGIVITAGQVGFKKDNGYCSGKSLLLLDSSTQKTNLKAFMNKVGALVASTDVGPANVKYVVFNNLFNGGIKRFYESNNNNSGSQYTINVEHNANIDLVDTENFEKK
jgi:hypothetical protein